MTLQVRGSLQRHVPHTPTDESELYRMRQAAWHKQGVAVLRPADIADQWTRQVVVNEANGLYDRREGA